MIAALAAASGQTKLIILAGIITVSTFAGYRAASYVKGNEIVKINAAHDKVLADANEKVRLADAKTLSTEQSAAKSISEAATKYEMEKQDAKALADRTVTDLRNSVVRLRVATTRAPGNCALPSAAGGASSGDVEAEQTLSPAVAARLAGRYADYNEIVGQLDLCQQTLVLDRLMAK